MLPVFPVFASNASTAVNHKYVLNTSYQIKIIAKAVKTLVATVDTPT